MFSVKGIAKNPTPSPSWRRGEKNKLRSRELPILPGQTLLFSGIKFTYGTVSPWLMLVFIILMAVSCSRGVAPGPVKGGYTIGANSAFKLGLSRVLEEYDSMSIPGVKEPYLDCGEFFKIWKCDKCGWKKPIPKRCFRAGCSECWESWGTKKVKYAVARLFGYTNVYKKIKGRRGYLADIMISPPQDYAKALVREPGGFNKLRKEAIEISRRYGLDGVVIPHLWRKRKNIAKELVKEYHPKSGSEFWDLIREDALKLGGWKKYVYLAPHFHVLGYLQKTINGADVFRENIRINKKIEPIFSLINDKYGLKTVDLIEEDVLKLGDIKKYGESWVWKQQADIAALAKGNADKAIKNGKKVETEEELVASKLFYFLSHAVIRGDKSALSWFGALSYNQMVKAEHSVIEEQRACPECGYDLVIENLETGEILPGLEKIDIWIYKIPPPDIPVTISGWCKFCEKEKEK